MHGMSPEPSIQRPVDKDIRAMAAEEEGELAALGREYGFSEEAVRTALDALNAGHGQQAQFAIPSWAAWASGRVAA